MLVRVLEIQRIQDKIESATEIASELRHDVLMKTRHREECEGKAKSMQVLDNATINLEKELFEMKHETAKVQVQDKDVSEKRAGGIYGQFLFEKGEEIKKNSPADNKITDQENWREVEISTTDEKQKMDVV